MTFTKEKDGTYQIKCSENELLKIKMWALNFMVTKLEKDEGMFASSYIEAFGFSSTINKVIEEK